MSDAPANKPAPAGAAPPPEADATLYLHPQTLAHLGTMELRAKHIVEGVMSGQHRSPYQGFSVEFAQHRQYTPGDDTRHLDWKVFARTDKLHLKQYEQETNLDVVVMVDASGSMDSGSRSYAEASGVGRKTSVDGRAYWSKFDHATACAAAMAYMALAQGDRAGLIVFADQILRMLDRSSAQRQWRQIVGALSTQPVEHETDLPRAVDQTLARLNNRCLIVLVSDFYTDPENLRVALARIKHRRHDAILFQVVDRREETFDFRETLPFDGLEGEQRLRVDPRAVRKAYLEAFNEHQTQVRRLARSFNFDYQLVRTHDWLGPPLAAFVARRNAQLKKLKMG
ncbi:MAG: DUF58 domain-containing protein [Phycisphaerales bacterium]